MELTIQDTKNQQKYLRWLASHSWFFLVFVFSGQILSVSLIRSMQME